MLINFVENHSNLRWTHCVFWILWNSRNFFDTSVRHCTLSQCWKMRRACSWLMAVLAPILWNSSQLRNPSPSVSQVVKATSTRSRAFSSLCSRGCGQQHSQLRPSYWPQKADLCYHVTGFFRTIDIYVSLLVRLPDPALPPGRGELPLLLAHGTPEVEELEVLAELDEVRLGHGALLTGHPRHRRLVQADLGTTHLQQPYSIQLYSLHCSYDYFQFSSKERVYSILISVSGIQPKMWKSFKNNIYNLDVLTWCR